MNFWFFHIIALALLYTGIMGAAAFDGHTHVHASATELCAATAQAGSQDTHDPCGQADCASHSCCNVHCHHLMATRATSAAPAGMSPTDFAAPEPGSPLLDFTSDIFHPPRIS